MLSFFKQALSHYKTTGAIAPSSERLARLFIETGRIREKKVIVEFGPGTGIFTKEILKEKSSDCVYIGIELNDFFYNQIIQKYPNEKIYHGSSENVDEFLKKNNLDKCDCIISGLPWANFEEKLQEKILKKVESCLEEGGEFLTFAYNFGLLTKKGRKFKKKLPEFFSEIQRTRTVIRNIPPAFIYHAKKTSGNT